MCRGRGMKGLFLFCILVCIAGCPDGVGTVSEDGHCGGEIRCPDDLVCAPVSYTHLTLPTIA